MANDRMTSKEPSIAMNKEPQESRSITQESGNSHKKSKMPPALVNGRKANSRLLLTALAANDTNILSSRITGRAIVLARIFIPGSFTFTTESMRATIRREFIPGRGPFSVIHHRDPARTKVAYLKALESSKFEVPKLEGTVVERLNKEQDDKEEN